MARLSEVIGNACVLPDLQAADAAGVLRELVQSLVQDGYVAADAQEAVASALSAREEIGSTGIGFGCALPHVKHAAVKSTVAAIGRSVEGLDFNALDGKPVFIFILLLSPTDAVGELLELLAVASRLVRSGLPAAHLRRAPAPDEMLRVIADHEAEAEGSRDTLRS